MSSLLASTQKTYPASLLLNFDGANNSTTFTDSSSYNHTGTAYGNAKISTTQSKFGGSSGYFDGAEDYVSYSSHSSFNFGAGDFTIECWVYVVDTGGGPYVIWSRWNNNGDNKIQLYFTNGTLYYQNGAVTISGGSIVQNSWQHVTVLRSGSTIRIFLDGRVVAEGTSSDNVDSTSNFVVGANDIGSGGANYFYGYIDSLRIVKGVALYTNTSYVLPSVPAVNNAIIQPKLVTHILATTTLSNGSLLYGQIKTDSGYYTVQYWNSKKTYQSDESFAKTAIGGSQEFWIYPSTSSGSLSGYIIQAELPNNSITNLRLPYNFYYGQYVPAQYLSTWPWYLPPSTTYYQLDISNNLLSSSNLDQVYTDLQNGNGLINVIGNSGVNSDTTSIATNKGYTVYGSTSPTVELLLNLNGTNGSTTFTDSGDNSRSITVQKVSPSLTTSNYKYGTAALTCNSGTIGTTSKIIGDLSSLDFTIEAWVYKTNTDSQHICLLPENYTSSTAGISFYLGGDNHVYFNNGTVGSASTTTPAPTGIWTHLAAVKKRDKRFIYIDGVLCNSPIDSADTIGPYSADIGGFRVGSTWYNIGTMLIDDFRIVRSKAIYNNDFVPPSSALTNSTSSVAPGITVLLLNGNGTNNSTTFTDSGHKNLTATRAGNTVISTAQYKYGTASIYFDGTGDYLIYNGHNFNFFNSDFTIECWIRPANVTGTKGLFSKRSDIGTTGGVLFQLNGNKLQLVTTNDGNSWQINIESSTTLSANTWYHVAATRVYDTFRIFIDGNLENSQTVENFIVLGNIDTMVIGAGADQGVGGDEFNGYIDDFRIIRGVSLYNENFTAPSAQLGIYP